MKYCPSFTVNHLKMAESIPGSTGYIKAGSRPVLAVGQSLPIPVLGGKSYTCSVFQSQRRPQTPAMQPQQTRASPHRGTGSCNRDEAGCPEPFALAASHQVLLRLISGKYPVLFHISPQELSFWNPRTWAVDWERKQVKKGQSTLLHHPQVAAYSHCPWGLLRTGCFSPEKRE